MGKVIAAKPVVPGSAQGYVIAAQEPISFWGGYDHHTGDIIDRRHALSGKNAAGKILCVPFTRGSSTTTAVLLEAVRCRTAPAAIITTAVDSFFALASIVAKEMYGHSLPIAVVWMEEFQQLQPDTYISITEDGTLYIQ